MKDPYPANPCRCLSSRGILIKRKGDHSFRILVRGVIGVWICLALVSANGCMIIPTPESGLLAGRGKIEEADIAFLKVGVTTRENVLLRFGEPDAVLHDQRILAYYWAVSVGYIIVYNAGAEIPKNYLFILEFDDAGLLKRAEISASGWNTIEARLNKWVQSTGK
jgi:hypothetical protein